MTLKKSILVALTAVLCAWYYATPYLAFTAMKAAADRKDAQALSEYVDYPAVRESLKSAFKAKMAAAVAMQAESTPFAEFGARLAAAIVDTLVDAMITPQGLANLMSAEQPAAKSPTLGTPTEPPNQDSKGQPSERDTVIARRYAGWNRFEISASKMGQPEQKVTLVMLRQGIASWKLSAIDLQLK